MTTAEEGAPGTAISRVELARLRIPLEKPYRLSFGVVEAYDTILVMLHGEDGRSSFGEATVLTGYSDETIEASWSAAVQFAQQLPGTDAAGVITGAIRLGERLPFCATAFATAAEMLSSAPVLTPRKNLRIPLVGLFAAKDEKGLIREFEEQWASGFRTLKVKVGFDVPRDVELVKTVQGIVAGKAKIRIDANQGYTADQGVSFVSSVSPDCIELFEQPCPAWDWQSHLAVLEHSQLPMMLDESIHGIADIERAASLEAARFIKLKLMKLVTLERLEQAILRIKELGMTAVLGNGVAADPGCWMEACVAAPHIDNAGEMNGHLKTGERLLGGDGMRLVDGALVIDAGYTPTLQMDVIDRRCQASMSFRT